jgi:hypothetical protein
MFLCLKPLDPVAQIHCRCLEAWRFRERTPPPLLFVIEGFAGAEYLLLPSYLGPEASLIPARCAILWRLDPSHVQQGFDSPKVFDSPEEMRRCCTQLHGTLGRGYTRRGEVGPSSSAPAHLLVQLPCISSRVCFGGGRQIVWELCTLPVVVTL